MLEQAKLETQRTQTSILVEAAREWNLKHRKQQVSTNNGKVASGENLESVKITPEKKISEAELHLVKKLEPELKKPTKLKRRKE